MAVVLSVLTIVVEAGMAEAATMTTTAVLLVMMIANVAPTDGVTTMAPVALIAMPPPVAMIGTAAAEMIVGVVMNTMVGTPGGRAIPLRMASRRHQERPEIRTAEVELSTTVLMIGSPVDRLLSANLLRCGALCQITRLTPASCSQASDRQHFSRAA